MICHAALQLVPDSGFVFPAARSFSRRGHRHATLADIPVMANTKKLQSNKENVAKYFPLRRLHSALAIRLRHILELLRRPPVGKKDNPVA